MKATFTWEKETKNAHRFAEDGPEAKHVVGTLYLKKAALEEEGKKVSEESIVEADFFVN